MRHNTENKSNIENKRAASHKSRAIIQTAFWMAVLTLISKFLGFAREMVMAGFYGTSYITDAYVMATSIPAIIFGGFFGAFATSYMPTYSKIREVEGEEEGNRYTSQVLNLLVILSIISAITGIVFSDQLMSIFARGFEGEVAELTSFFIKITFSYIIFTSTAGILGSYLQYRNIFLSQIVAGYGQNIIIIIVIAISAYTSHYLLAFGMLFGSLAKLIIIAYIGKNNGYKYRLSLSLSKRVQEIGILALPAFLGTYIVEINIFVGKTLASSLPEGSIAALNYGMLLVELITGLTSTILTTIVYPKLTYFNTLDNQASFNNILNKAVNTLIIIVGPCSLGAMAFSKQIVQIVYERGAFDSVATGMTTSCFFMYAGGMCFISLNALFIKTFYSMKDMRTPLMMCAIGLAINIFFSVLLVKPMAHTGLAIAFSIGAACNTTLLFIALKKLHPYILIIDSIRKLIKIAAASVFSVMVSYLFYRYVASNKEYYTMALFVQMFLTVGIAVILYYALLRLFKVEEVKMLNNLLNRNK